jgi:hypothetical protein
MHKYLTIAATVILVATASPAIAAKGSERSCAGMAAPIEGGGFVAFIIRSFGADWWAQFWAQPTDCG